MPQLLSAEQKGMLYSAVPCFGSVVGHAHSKLNRPQALKVYAISSALIVLEAAMHWVLTPCCRQPASRRGAPRQRPPG